MINLPETRRTVIERITLDDAAFFVRLVNSREWHRFIGDRSVSNEEDARQYLRGGFLRSYAEHGFGYYLARLKNSNTPIGIAGFLKKPMLENPDFGFALLPSFFGQGLAFEISTAILDYGIKACELRVLDAVVTADNARSIRLLVKLGFEAIGHVQKDDDEPLRLYRWTTPESPNESRERGS